eukprot:3109886-Pyramimonas_sp.AAC.1
MDPRGIDPDLGPLSGIQAPYNAEQCAAALKSAGHCKAAGNLFWLNMACSPTPGAPINEKNAQRLVAHKFDEPRRVDDVVLAVACESKDFQPHVHKGGGLKRVALEEVLHAVIFGIEQAIDAGASDDVMKKWLAVCLTMTFRFELLEGTD